MNELLDKVWREYTEAMMTSASDVEEKWRTWEAVLEQFLRRLERS